MSATIGAVTQSNYAGANQFLDSLAQYRYSHGLPALTINWGQWGQVGLAADIQVTLYKPFSVAQGLAVLEHAIKNNHTRTQVAAYDADLPKLRQVFPSTRGLFSDIEEEQDHSANEALTALDGDEFYREYDATSSQEERYTLVANFLKRLTRLTLKMDPNEEIDDHTNFQDLGMDSLMMVEMKNGLQASVGKRVKISINAVKDCKTVAQLSARLVELISGKEEELPIPTPEELRALVLEDAILPEHIKVTPAVAETLVPLSKVKSVLFLGATGALGAYLLVELLKRPTIEKITCILRDASIHAAKERFLRKMKEKRLLPQIEEGLPRIEFVLGDTTKSNLGLDGAIHTRLAGSVDAIINAAAAISFYELYRKTEQPSSTRIGNVFSMKNIISFAANTKLKVGFTSIRFYFLQTHTVIPYCVKLHKAITYDLFTCKRE
jgi:acyl carrier protein